MAPSVLAPLLAPTGRLVAVGLLATGMALAAPSVAASVRGGRAAPVPTVAPPARPSASGDGGADGQTTYRAPVAGSVAEGFHAPASPFAPGHRGLDYAVAPGEPVMAAAGGVVLFAGPTPGGGAVTVQHPDGVRTALTGVTGLRVAAGEAVGPGQVVGVASGPRVFFSARINDAYVDPAVLIGGPAHAHLVPNEGR